jgi:hypothetical protein
LREGIKQDGKDGKSESRKENYGVKEFGPFGTLTHACKIVIGVKNAL